MVIVDDEAKGDEGVLIVGSGMSYHNLRALFSQRPFLLLFLSYSLNTGLFYTFGTILNSLLQIYNPVWEGLECSFIHPGGFRVRMSKSA